MSSYRVIARVSTTLKEILWAAYSEDGEIRTIVGNDKEQAIVFKNPTETAKKSANKLSLWLYQITENEFLKNQPMLRAAGNGNVNQHQQTQFPPLALNLFYLVTPFASRDGDDGRADHRLLGKTMEVLYDNAMILVEDETEEIAEELRVVFCRLTLEELTRVWEALREPYRLSVCYQIRVTRIDSQRAPERGRVLAQTTGTGDKLLEARG
jgi:hypothetical protein